MASFKVEEVLIAVIFSKITEITYNLEIIREDYTRRMHGDVGRPRKEGPQMLWF